MHGIFFTFLQLPLADKALNYNCLTLNYFSEGLVPAQSYRGCLVFSMYASKRYLQL